MFSRRKAKKSLRKIIIGNWKMNPVSWEEADRLSAAIAKSLAAVKRTEMVICPPFVYLERLKKKSARIALGAQDVFWNNEGAFTGEISPVMLWELGVKYVILGHSERRALGESNRDIGKKIKAALGAGLIPIVCVGEESRDESHNYFNLVKMQLAECLNTVSRNLISKVIVAYEPIWAISSTVNHKDATPHDSREMSIFIRKILFDRFGVEAQKTRVIYGGSVNERDAEGFLKEGGVDGLLPGRASLDAKKFAQIVRIAERI